ncbi:MAG: substrate-binding domain-containing protein [Deltaproteobacteria bacterium]|nr:substrate-binding domain-containing protein [Deltaproteobacteria bacterium]
MHEGNMISLAPLTARIAAVVFLLSCIAVTSGCNKEQQQEAGVVTIRVVHPPEVGDYLKRVEGAFEQSEHRLAGGIKVAVDLVEAESLYAAKKIASGELKTEAWVPSSTTLVNYTNQNLKNLGPKQVDCRQLFGTPLVIATTEKNVEAFQGQERSFSWKSFVEGGNRRKNRSDNAVSMSIARSGLAVSGTSALLQLAFFALESYEGTLSLKNLESDHFKSAFSNNFDLVYFLEPSDSALLERIAGAKSERVLFGLTTEQQLAQYNFGAPPDAPKLVALYPREGSLWQDYNLCLSNADWVTPPQRAGVSLFASFLSTRAAQSAAMQAGFRPASLKGEGDKEVQALSDPLTKKYGITPQAATAPVLPFPSQVVEHVLATWQEYRRPAINVVVLDVSGTTTSGAFYSAIRLSGTLLDSLSPKDQAAVLTFADKVSVVAPAGTQKELIKAELAKISAGGGSAMYQGIYEAFKQASDDRHAGYRRNIIVLTDGKDNKSTISLPDLLDFISDSRKHTDINLQIIGLKSEKVDLGDLEKIARTAGGKFWSTSLGEVDKIVQSIITEYL